jgi:hypothetical protein
MWKVSKAKLSRKEFTRAIALFAITSFIVGVGFLPVWLATIDKNAPLIPKLLIYALSFVGCLVIWPLFMVWGVIRDFRRKNLVQKEKKDS